MGQGGGGALISASLRARERRAATLLKRHPPAAEPLAFYLKLLEAQEPLCYHPRLPAWLAVVDSGGVAGAPALRLERLPVEELEEDVRRFVEDLAPACTPVLAPVARRLALDPALGIEAARAFVAGEPLAPLSERVACDEAALAFFPRAFLQPIGERLAVLAADAAPSWPADSAPPADTAPLCPSCGHPPVVGSLVDEPDHQGRRRLVCSLCGTAWPFPRLTCAGCLDTGAERLAHHVSEAWPHVRVDECATCGRYQKTVDLRAAGDAVPVVDELASMELDLWADERGLRKLQPNLLGL